VQQQKNECQQNNVKHSDGLPEKQIAHLSCRYFKMLRLKVLVTPLGCVTIAYFTVTAKKPIGLLIRHWTV